MEAMRTYYERVTGLLERVEKEKESVAKAARLTSEAIEKDRLLHVFGTGGHSYIGAEEMFWRAGGLVPVNPIFDPGVSLSHGGTRSSMIERLPGYVKPVLEYYQVKKDDVMIIVNAYGINSATIDAAVESKRMGAKVIAITSPEFSKVVPPDHPARHPSKKSLFELEEVDVVIDCHMPPGDAVVEIEGFSQKVAPVSTILNAFVLNSIVACTVENLVKKGITPPVWMSGNMPGGDEANKKYIEKYFERIKHL